MAWPMNGKPSRRIPFSNANFPAGGRQMLSICSVKSAVRIKKAQGIEFAPENSNGRARAVKRIKHPNPPRKGVDLYGLPEFPVRNFDPRATRPGPWDFAASALKRSCSGAENTRRESRLH